MNGTYSEQNLIDCSVSYGNEVKIIETSEVLIIFQI